MDASEDNQEFVSRTMIPETSDIDEDSDLNMDINVLARQPVLGTTLAIPTTSEVTLSDDDEHSDNVNDQESSTASNRYGFRRRRVQVNYSDVVNGDSDSDSGTPTKKSKSHSGSKSKPMASKDLLHLSPLLRNPQQLKKYIKNPTLAEELTHWSLNLKTLQSNTSEIGIEDNLSVLTTFIEKCGRYVDKLTIVNNPDSDNSNTLSSNTDTNGTILLTLFKSTELLTKLTFRYEKQERNDKCLVELFDLVKKSRLKSINSVRLVSVPGTEIGVGVVTKSDFNSLVGLGLKLSNVELGDALWEDITGKDVETFLQQNKDCLESLIIHGGFRGFRENRSASGKFVINFPTKMTKLKVLCVCPNYGFVSERRNPLSKKSRVVRLDRDDNTEEPFKVTLKMDSDIKTLEKLVLGNLIELEEFGLSLVRRLKVFRCGSRWDLAIRFPKENNSSKGPCFSVRELQLPDGLKDPSFVQKVGEFFPHVKKVFINLPSVGVLRAFFKAFENSLDLEELYLKTQFDFETTMESCLLPEPRSSVGEAFLLSQQSERTNSQVSILRTLKEYKHFDDYVRYHNIELPSVDIETNLMDESLEGPGAGIRALKSLKVLELEHIPRVLLIPNPEDERRWYDYNFKYLHTTFGFELYPFSRRCHDEILRMNLQQYNWRNLDIPSSVTHQFGQAGYVTLNDIELLDTSRTNAVTVESDDEDLFIQIPNSSNQRTKGRSNINVAIQPSMLLPNYFKNKNES